MWHMRISDHRGWWFIPKNLASREDGLVLNYQESIHMYRSVQDFQFRYMHKRAEPNIAGE